MVVEPVAADLAAVGTAVAGEVVVRALADRPALPDVHGPCSGRPLYPSSTPAVIAPLITCPSAHEQQGWARHEHASDRSYGPSAGGRSGIRREPLIR